MFENFTDGTACNNTVFGQDPAPGIVKSCYIPAGPAGFSFCSSEDGTCKSSEPLGYYLVFYGFDGAFRSLSGEASAIDCNNGTFGLDPVPGIVKACFVFWTYAQ